MESPNVIDKNETIQQNELSNTKNVDRLSF